MRKRLLLLVPLCTALMSGAEERRPGLTISSQLNDGLSVSVYTYCTGKSPAACLGQSGIEALMPSHNPRAYVVVARRSRSWFGYSFTAERIGNEDTVQVSIGPLSPESGPEGFAQVPLPKYDPGPFTLAPGDILRIPLLVNPNTNETLISDLQFSPNPVSHGFIGPALNTENPRDFALQDVQMRLVQFELLVNGKKVKGVGGSGEGRVVWYTIEGLSSGVLAFAPQSEPGFRKGGVIQGRTMRYRIGSDEYEWRSTEPILSGSGAYNLYLYSEPGAGKGATYGWGVSAEGALKGIAMFKAN